MTAIRMTDRPMQLGMVGLGRMGSNLVRRLHGAGHDCVVYDRDPAAVERLQSRGIRGVGSVHALVDVLHRPRVVWLMVPAGVVESIVAELLPLLAPDDVIIDGGNSYYRDDIDRSRLLADSGIHFVDCGTSGGVWGLERGYCLMIGGDSAVVERLDPIFATIAPGRSAASPTPGRSRTDGSAPDGYLHCGPVGAGHFVKMVHNGVEYGMMAAIAEGLAILEGADVGQRSSSPDAETAPLRDPAAYQYDIDVSEVAEVWRRGSVVASWLVDLVADALAGEPDLSQFAGRVSDSGEGRWTAVAAIDEGIPAPVISAALHRRFVSQGSGGFADRVLSAMRWEFGGHAEKT